MTDCFVDAHTDINSKKVLILVHDLNIGGVGTSLVNVCRLLKSQNCKIVIKTTSRNVSEQLLSRIDNDIRVEICDEPRYPFFEILPYIKNFYESGMWTARNTPRKVYNHFVRKNERDQYDIEMAFYYGRPTKAICGSTNLNSRKIMWIRLGMMDDNYYPGFLSKESAIEGYNKFDKIIGVSEDVCDNFIGFTGIKKEKVVAIHNYLDKENIDRCLQEKCELTKTSFTISYVCRLVPVKNVMALIHVIEMLQKEGLDCACWLVGDGPLKNEIESYIKEHGLRNIIITGYQKNPHKYVKASDLYVSTSLMEGYPNTIADSMYIGTPIVSTRCVGAPNILRNGKYGILTDFDEESIYQGIRKMMTDKATYNYYKTVIRDFDFEKEAEEISRDLLKAIMGEKNNER